MKNPVASGGATGLENASFPGENDDSSNAPNAPKTAATQENLLRNPRAVREAKLELLRDAVHELAGFIQIHASICQSCAEAGDDAGLIHSLGRLVIYTRHAAKIGNDLREARR
jgi:hypothetical protein